MDTQLTAHFNVNEFTCKCGCRTNQIKLPLVQRLEKIFDYLSQTADGCGAIFVTSGYRCPRHSVAVGGSFDDAHTRGIAADIYAVKNDGETRWGAFELAAVCERVGFTGIGIIDNTAVHADIRTSENYKNAHWFGNEMTGNDNIPTFADYLPRQRVNVPIGQNHIISVYLDGKKIFESEVK